MSQRYARQLVESGNNKSSSKVIDKKTGANIEAQAKFDETSSERVAGELIDLKRYSTLSIFTLIITLDKKTRLYQKFNASGMTWNFFSRNSDDTKNRRKNQDEKTTETDVDFNRIFRKLHTIGQLKEALKEQNVKQKNLHLRS